MSGCKCVPSTVTITKIAYKLFDMETANKLIEEACGIVNVVEAKHLHFFCNKSPTVTLAGLFYLLAKKHEIKLAAWDISNALPSSTVGRTSLSGKIHPNTVNKSAGRWLDVFPEYFKELPQ
ncbi:MAG: hypothetical protein WC365_06590 [Candidatus Babeliales bacterium]|jgi:hypothetical protein